MASVNPSVWHYRDPSNGCVMPWYTVGCLRWLLEKDKSAWRVLEWGAGLGSEWWCTVAYSVLSIEHDKEWANRSGALWKSGVEDYVYPVEVVREGPFDCIVVDGEYRTACMIEAMKLVRPGGYVILDNSNRAGYALAREQFRFNTCMQFPQPNHPDWRTDVWHVETKEEPVIDYTEAAARQEEGPWPL